MEGAGLRSEGRRTKGEGIKRGRDEQGGGWLWVGKEEEKDMGQKNVGSGVGWVAWG